jgi:hypothetical protein
MTVYCDLEMDTETALELLKFVQSHQASQPALSQLFDEITQQVTASLEYEAQYVPGSLRKSKSH